MFSSFLSCFSTVFSVTSLRRSVSCARGWPRRFRWAAAVVPLLTISTTGSRSARFDHQPIFLIFSPKHNFCQRHQMQSLNFFGLFILLCDSLQQWTLWPFSFLVSGPNLMNIFCFNLFCKALRVKVGYSVTLVAQFTLMMSHKPAHF